MFSPLKVGGLTLKNRIVAAPMTYPILTSDGCLTPEAIAFYELRAKGGAAAVTVSEVIVDGKMGKYYPIQVVLDARTPRTAWRWQPGRSSGTARFRASSCRTAANTL